MTITMSSNAVELAIKTKTDNLPADTATTLGTLATATNLATTTDNTNTLITNTGNLTKKVSKSITLNGNAAQVDNLFTITGSVHIIKIYGIVTEATNATTLTGIQFDAYDGTNTVALSDATLSMSGTTVGSMVIKKSDAAAALEHAKADQVRMTAEGLADNYTFALTQKNATATYIRVNFTGDINTDVDVTFFVEYEQLSASSAVAAV